MGGPPFIPLEIRYERYIRRGASPDDCWVWTGAANKAGYGQFRIGRSGRGRPVISVHRWAYERFVGPIPEGGWVLHRCDRPGCSNPRHLYAGSPLENAADCTARGRRAVGPRPFKGRIRTLTDDAVRAIRVDERPVHEVALAFGIAETTVTGVRKRRRKAHVPD